MKFRLNERPLQRLDLAQFNNCVTQFHLVAVEGPRAEFHQTTLLVERKVLDVNSA